MHVCCAPCAIALIEELKENQLTLFFYNPNIMPQEEYFKRLEAVKQLAFCYQLKLVIGKVDDSFFELTKGLENEIEGGKRCFACFENRLMKTASLSDDFDYFVTSLVMSPYKNAIKINQIGKKISKKYLAIDFNQERYNRSITLSKKNQLYRQKYCGCNFKFSS